MRNLFLLTVAFIFILGGTAYGTSSSIAVFQSTDDISNPQVDLVQSGSNSTSMRIGIDSIVRTEVEVAGNRFDKISISDDVDLIRSTTGETGKPELPLHTTTLAIPDRGGIEIRINSSSYEVIEDVDIAPVQAPIHEGEEESGVLTIDNEVYTTDAFYPREIVWANEPFVIRDFRGAGIVYCPVQYNPVTRQLRVYNNIDFDIVYTDEDAPNPGPARKQYISEAFKPLYKSLFDNYDEVCADLPSKRGGYLIITHEMFYDSLLEFASWKHRKGYDVHLVPLTEIASNPSAYNIFEYIESAYNNWEIAPEFILLVGDVTMPGGKRFPDYSYSYYTSDYPYGCVVGDDYFQDIMVSRWAIDNETELSKILRKTLTYEQFPEEMEDGWMDRALSVGCNAGGWGPIPTTPRLTTLWVRQKLFDNGFAQCDTCFDWSGGPYCNENVITTALNNGTNIVSYRGLAGPSGWACPDYYYYDLNTLNNGYRGGVMVSIVCGSGHYGSSTDPCFGEAWIRGGYGSDIRGGVVFYGTTDTDTHTRWNNPLMVGLYWGLFDENLTHFGQSVYRGKLLQYAVFPQHTQPYGTVELYFHTYNPLGDPELNIWRGTPEFMNAAYPQNISVSSNYIEFNVFNEGNQPVADAHVCALKELGGEDEIFTVGKTDESGFVLLPLNGNPSQGDMYITITHNDYLPIIDTITVTQPSVALGYSAHTIDDDNNGYSHGNGDNIANPSEYIEVALTISNRGEQRAEDVIGNLTIDDPYGKVLSGANTFGAIQPAGSATANFVIMVSPDCPDGYSLPYELSLNYSGGNEMTTLMEVDVSSPGLMVSAVNIDDYGGNSNGILDPGETASVVIDLLNNGGGDAFAVNCVLDSDDAYIQLLDVEGEFGNIHVGETGSNVETPFMITADDDAFEGRTCHFTLHTVNEYGTGFDVPFTIELGSRTEDDPVGPDNYGYYIYDELDAGYSEMPSYDWVDIGDTGTRVAAADDRSDLVTLPFDFKYYGETYNAIIISSNGFVAVDTAAYDMGGNRWALFFNWPQPDPNGPGGQISPFWDDLDGSAYGGKVVYEYDSPNNRFIVQWDNVRAKWGSYYETFEMIIYDASFHRTATGDCPILFQYNDVYDGDYDENYCTVGFESFDEFDGLQYAFCHEYSPGAAAIDDGRALLISPNTGRGRIYGNATLAGNPDNSGIKITTSTGQKGYTSGAGSYTVVDAEVGSVDMAFSKIGYLTQIISGVNVISNDRTDAQAVELQMAPVPQNLDASENAGDHIDITWEEASPNAVGYNLYRSEYENGLFVKLNDEPITGLSYTDSDVTADETYWYYATAIYEFSISFASNKDAGSTGMVGLDDDESNLPAKLALSQNYPNPFNASTTIKYALPSDGNVKLEVFNLMGQRVETLVEDYQQAGYKSLTWNFADRASGIYFYRLTADGKTMVKRMTILK